MGTPDPPNNRKRRSKIINSDDAMKSIYKTLKKPEAKRTSIENNKLYLMVKEIKFIKSLVDKKPMEQVISLVSKLKYEKI